VIEGEGSTGEKPMINMVLLLGILTAGYCFAYVQQPHILREKGNIARQMVQSRDNPSINERKYPIGGGRKRCGKREGL
jgi:hypothetical protein